MLNKPHILTIKVFTVGDVPSPEAIDAMLGNTDYNLSLLSMEAVKEQAATPKAKVAEPKPKSSPALRPVGTKPIVFTEGSDAEKVWILLRDGPGVTSTQIREKTGLTSGIVNTTIYRLKNAGMIRPMSHTAINGDTLYTTTHLDAKE